MPQLSFIRCTVCHYMIYTYKTDSLWSLISVLITKTTGYIPCSLLIKGIKRLCLNHTVQTSNMQYAFGVQVYGDVLYRKFYSVFLEPFKLTMKYCSVKDYNSEPYIPLYKLKRSVEIISSYENKYFQKSP